VIDLLRSARQLKQAILLPPYTHDSFFYLTLFLESNSLLNNINHAPAVILASLTIAKSLDLSLSSQLVYQLSLLGHLGTGFY